MADKTIMDLATLTSVDRAADYFEVADTSDSNASKRSSVNSMLDLTSHPVGIDDVQTFTNKTLTAPTISSPVLSGTVTGTYTLGGTPTLPSSVATLTGIQTLTNKTLTSPAINTPTISNPTITVDAISEFTAANGVSVDGLNIKDGKLNTNNSVVTANITDAAVSPNKLVAGTGSAWEWVNYTPTFTGLSGGTLTFAAWCQIGKTVFFRIKYTLTGANVSGSVTFTTPTSIVSALTANTDIVMGHAYFTDTGTANYFGGFARNSANSLLVLSMNAAGTYLVAGLLSSTAPFTWTVGDVITFVGSYEAAA